LEIPGRGKIMESGGGLGVIAGNSKTQIKDTGGKRNKGRSTCESSQVFEECGTLKIAKGSGGRTRSCTAQ